MWPCTRINFADSHNFFYIYAHCSYFQFPLPFFFFFVHVILSVFLFFFHFSLDVLSHSSLRASNYMVCVCVCVLVYACAYRSFSDHLFIEAKKKKTFDSWQIASTTTFFLSPLPSFWPLSCTCRSVCVRDSTSQLHSLQKIKKKRVWGWTLCEELRRHLVDVWSRGNHAACVAFWQSFL